MHSLSIIVPLYNEEESIGQLHERLLPIARRLCRDCPVQLILIDDGSTDQTQALLRHYFGPVREPEVFILRHPVNRGIAAAMRTGFGAATGDLVCTIDCDCTYSPEEIPNLLELLLNSEADIVTASPYHPIALQEDRAYRFILSRMCSVLYRYILPVKLFCYTSFFRIYRRHWVRTDLFQSNGFLGVTELLVTAAYFGAQIVEYPTRLRTRLLGRSKMRTIQVIRDHLELMWRSLRLNLQIGRRRLSISNFPRPLEGGLAPYSLDPVAEGYATMLERWVLVDRFGQEQG